MFPDFIRETEIYQYILQEGREQGIKQGREQVRQEALLRQRQILIAFVQARYTELVPFATAQAEQINNVDVLNKLMLNVSLAQNLEEVRHYLQDAKDKQTH